MKIKNLFLGYIFISMFSLSSCNSENSNHATLLTFDISPDGNNLVFALAEEGKSSIYKLELKNRNIEKLFDAEDSISFYSPRFNTDGDSIVFISSNFPKKLNSTIWVANLSNNEKQVVLDDPTIKTEVIFSKNGGKFYYLQAEDYAGYSPLGRKAAHKFDIMELENGSRRKCKVSDFSAYDLRDLSEPKEDTLLFSGQFSNFSGLCFMHVPSKSVKMILLNNDSLDNIQNYTNPVFVNDQTLIASSFYKLVSLNLLSKKAITIFEKAASHFGTIRFSKNLKQIFASIENENVIYVFGPNGQVLDMININL